jgi:hypothetical protein
LKSRSVLQKTVSPWAPPPEADIVPLRIANSVAHFFTSAVAAALSFAVQIKCDVASMSMGGLPSVSGTTRLTLRMKTVFASSPLPAPITKSARSYAYRCRRVSLGIWLMVRESSPVPGELPKTRDKLQ